MVKKQKYTYLFFYFFFILFSKNIFAKETIIPLKIHKVYPVESQFAIEPSGLTLYQDTLFTVLDNIDDAIFFIDFINEKAILKPYKTFDAPSLPDVYNFDFEGITNDISGNFYLVSEKGFRILKVPHSEKKPEWITPHLKTLGERQGLFKTRNAYLEGIAYLGTNKFIVCAERQPRGIIELDLSKPLNKSIVLNCDYSHMIVPKPRKPDFSGLFFDGSSVFILNRATDSVCQIIYDKNTFYENNYWSFKNVVIDEQYKYNNMTFGHAEGLAMDQHYIYIILDNNGESRVIDPTDYRPLLLILKRPKN